MTPIEVWTILHPIIRKMEMRGENPVLIRIVSAKYWWDGLMTVSETWFEEEVKP